jgi:hypothetical protein
MVRTYVLAGLAALGTACSADSGEMVILSNQVPAASCVLSAAPGGRAKRRRQLHPPSEVGDVFTPVEPSNLGEAGSPDKLIFLDGADVTLDQVTADGDATVAEFGVPFAGSIAARGTIGVGFEVTPRGIGEGDYVAHIQIRGTLDGGDVSSQVFDYPIRVSQADYEQSLGACDLLEEGYVGVIDGNACNPLQDGFVECCTDGDDLICPAVGPEPPPA